METSDCWQAFVSTGSVQEYLHYKQAQRNEEQAHGSSDQRFGIAGSEGGGGG